MSARIQDTFDLPVSDECGCSDARMVTQESNSASRPTGIGDVSAVRHSSSDAAREVAILHAGQEIERHMAEVAAINNRDPHTFADFADAAMARQRAQFARQDMERLIRERSPEYVAQLERERGLTHSVSNDAKVA